MFKVCYLLRRMASKPAALLFNLEVHPFGMGLDCLPVCLDISLLRVICLLFQVVSSSERNNP